MVANDHADEPPSAADSAGQRLVQVSVEQHGTTVVLDVAGEIDQLSVPELERPLTQAVQQRPPVLVVDLSAVEFLASTGLSALVAAHQQADEHTSLRVVAHGSATLRPIQLVGLDRELTVCQTREEALVTD